MVQVRKRTNDGRRISFMYCSAELLLISQLCD
jgi:hypothetical protein